MKKLRDYQLDAFKKIQEVATKKSANILISASVGAGKSLVIAETIRFLQSLGNKVLCLTMNSTLIKQNHTTLLEQGLKSGIYCATLKQYDTENTILFASPQSVMSAIKRGLPLARKNFDWIVVDECHNINESAPKSAYMMIFNAFKARVIGLTGTPFRDKCEPIWGDNKLFTHCLTDISTDYLIKRGFLTTPVWEAVNHAASLDFSKLKKTSSGLFNTRELNTVATSQHHKTHLIMQEVKSIMQSRAGVFIFASSINHCEQCLESLGERNARIITGNTPTRERESILHDARCGRVKYLINVAVLCTGVDVPNFDTVVFVRPTESRILYTQALGRGLRLSPHKKDCLVLDYAGNLERFSGEDDPIINKALNDIFRDDDVIECFKCHTFNTLFTRRCRGMVGDNRCGHYFVFKECPKCAVKNDITARHCRHCHIELIDPNDKLSISAANKRGVRVEVLETVIGLVPINNGVLIKVNYFLPHDQKFSESFAVTGVKSRNICYHRFLKHHFKGCGHIYRRLHHFSVVKKFMESHPPRKMQSAVFKVGVNGAYIVSREFGDNSI